MNTPTMMVGTSGVKEYLIIGQKEGLAVGVRPLTFREDSTQVSVGVRIRVCRCPEEYYKNNPNIDGGDQKISDLHIGEKAKELFPTYPFFKIDEKRASFMVMTSVWGDNLYAKIMKSGLCEALAETLMGVFEDGFERTVRKTELEMHLLELWGEYLLNAHQLKADSEKPVAKVLEFKLNKDNPNITDVTYDKPQEESEKTENDKGLKQKEITSDDS